MNENVKMIELESLIGDLFKNVTSGKYGEVVLSLRIHDSRIIAVIQSVTRNTVQKGGVQMNQ